MRQIIIPYSRLMEEFTPIAVPVKALESIGAVTPSSVTHGSDLKDKPYAKFYTSNRQIRQYEEKSRGEIGFGLLEVDEYTRSFSRDAFETLAYKFQVVEDTNSLRLITDFLDVKLEKSSDDWL